MIVVGAIVAFYGRKFFRWTVSVVGGFLTFLAAMLFFSVVGMVDYLEGNEQASLGLTILSFFLAIGAGAGAGALLYKYWRVGATLLAAAAGFFAGITVYQFAFHWTNNLYLMLGLAIGLALVLAALSFKIFHKVLIFGTSLIGSYSFIRGISLFAGHFPNEILVMQQLAQGQNPHFDYYFYAYMGGLVVMFVCGTVYQTKTHKDEEDDEYHKVQ